MPSARDSWKSGNFLDRLSYELPTLGAEVPLDKVADRTLPELRASRILGRGSRPRHVGKPEFPRHKPLAELLQDRAQFIIVAPLFEGPVDEVEHPDTFQIVHENCTLK
jgi:hypothetical protein